MNPTIFLKLEGATVEQAEHCRSIIELLFANDVFNIRRGSVTLHFDHEGGLKQIERDRVVWRKDNKDKPVAKLYDNVILEVK